MRSELERLSHHAIGLAREGLVEEARLVVSQIRELEAVTRVRMPRASRRLFCKRCRAPLIPGVTSRVRLASQGRLSYIVTRCLVCGWIHRLPYKSGRRASGPQAYGPPDTNSHSR